MVDPQIVGYLNTFIIAVISALGGGAVAYAKATAKRLREEQKRSQRHGELTDKVLCLLLRGQLVDEADRLLSDGWAGVAKRTSWEQTYQMYEELCTLSGTQNHVIEDIANDIAQLPTHNPKEKNNG